MMETNIRILISFLMIVLIILSFSLGYFFARTRSETRFLNAQVKLAKARLEMLFNEKENLKNIKAVNVKMDDEEIKDFLNFLENMKKEEEENYKNEK